MIDERFPSASRTGSASIRDHHTRARLDRHRPDHGGQPARRASSATPTPASTTTRRSSTACAPTTTSTDTETFGPLVGVARFCRLRRGDRRSPTATATACRRRSTRPTRSTRSASASASARGWSRQQLDVGRRGPPALRRQRQLGQRLAPVGHLGARPVHALAVGELGLRGAAAEGPDGDGRRRAPTLASACWTAVRTRSDARVSRPTIRSGRYVTPGRRSWRLAAARRRGSPVGARYGRVYGYDRHRGRRRDRAAPRCGCRGRQARDDRLAHAAHAGMPRTRRIFGSSASAA